jgi:H+/Cl- antiporter ClcA
MLLFIVLGMAGFFSAISKAPLTAIILVTEMVGSLNQLMVIGLVVLSSYVIMGHLRWRACLRSDVGKKFCQKK